MSSYRKRISAEVRQRVAEAAHFQCGYCLTSQRIVGPLLEIDHIIPEARGGTSNEDNLFLACPMCNSHKADRQEAVDPEDGSTASLFNPRAQIWDEHFEWSEGSTVSALNMNHPDVVVARRLWVIASWHPPVD